MILGALEWFQPGEHDRVERVVARMGQMQMTHIRTGISWAEWMRPENAAWFDWLVPRLAKDFDVLPCLTFTPPSLGVAPKVSSPPREPRSYADFVDTFCTQHGDSFEYIELWNEPNSLENWDYTLDPDWVGFGRTVGGAAHWAKKLGKRTVLGGMSPIDPNWLRLMFERGVMQYIDVVGVHGFPATWETDWRGWSDEVARVQAVLDEHQSRAAVWVTEVGHSTTRHDGITQLEVAQDLLALDVERAYWYSTEDLDVHRSALSGFHRDEREYHFGLWTRHHPKLLGRVLMEGRDPRELAWLVQEHHLVPPKDHIVVTGGAGFVGTNLVHRLLQDGQPVLVVDDLSRQGSLANLEWLRSVHGSNLRVHTTDVRDRFGIERAVRGAKAVFHLAGQVAVTTSVEDPLADFDINARGTLHVLEAVRTLAPDAFVLFSSTNKVYGALDTVQLVEQETRWQPKAKNGIVQVRANGREPAARPLSFATPYGCSKGAADQYVLDYARTFGLNATVLRMSCIYGPHQNGTSDQGWLVHFLKSAAEGRPLTVYGSGKQVRDVLHVDDLVEAYLRAMQRPEQVRGRAWDVGGGPSNTTSLLELMRLMETIGCPPTEYRWEPERPSDQRYFVADTAPLSSALDWRPKIGVEEGIRQVWENLQQRRPVVA